MDPKSCFIIAPFGTNTQVLADALRSRGISPHRLDDLQPGSRVLEALRRAIRDADFVCAVIPEEAHRENLFFEIGVALGTGRPVFAFVEPAVVLPFHLGAIPHIRARLDDSQSIDSQLDMALRSFVTKRQRRGIRRSRKENRINIEQARQQLTEFGGSSAHAGFRFEKFIADLFGQANIEVSATTHEQDRGADLAIWVDDVDEVLGNPILVELKSGQLSQNALQQAEQQLRHYLQKGPARCGLLVYLDVGNRDFASSESSWPLIFRLSAGELVDALATDSLADMLVARRNRAVHGQV